MNRVFCLDGLRNKYEFTLENTYVIEISHLSERVSQIVDSYFMKDKEDILHLELLILSISKSTDSATKNSKVYSNYVTFLDWCSYVYKDNNVLELTRLRTFQFLSYPDYVSFQCQGQAIDILSKNNFILQFDSSNPKFTHLDTNVEVIDHELFTSKCISTISWLQDELDCEENPGLITITFKLESDFKFLSNYLYSVQIELSCLSKDEHETKIQSIHIKLSIEDSDKCVTLFTLFHQSLYGFVRPNPIWTLDRDEAIIKVNLTKDCAGLWPRLLHDSFTDLALIEQTLTCDSTDNGFTLVEPSTNQPAFNVEQLEDVDEDESDLVLQRLDVEAMKITHKVNLSGNQWICKMDCASPNPSSSVTSLFCVRHDVDGTVWLSKSNFDAKNLNPWEHICTLQAFGYVLASKRDHRFVSCPLVESTKPIRFVAVADTVRHIYVYHQPVADQVNSIKRCSEVRRRGTSENTNEENVGLVHVAWLQLVTLPVNDMVLGFVTTERPYPACVVCTKSNLFLISLDC